MKRVLLTLVLTLSFVTLNAQIQLRGTTSATTTSTTLTINKPAGLQVGDIMLLQIVQSGNGGNGSSISDVNPIGWAEIAGINIRNTNLWWEGRYRVRATLLYKFATNVDVNSNNFSFSLDNDSDDAEGAIIAFSGVDNNSPFDGTPPNTNYQLDEDNSLTANNITTSFPNSAVIMFGAIGDNQNVDSWSSPNIGALHELYDVPFNATRDIGMSAAWEIKQSAGPTGVGFGDISGFSDEYNGALFVGLREGYTGPSLEVNPSNLTFGVVPDGNTSPEQNYILSGSNLNSGNITITAPVNFEVSLTSGSGFGSSVTVTNTGGTLANTNIYVRFIPTAADTDYNGNIINSGGGTTVDVSVNGTSDIPENCNSTGQTVQDEYISRVELNTIDNTSGAQTYSDFTNISTDLQKGDSYTISITPEWTGIVYPEGYAVWIDYNFDGDFEDSGELVFSQNSTTAPIVSGSFTVPTGGFHGFTTMRVSMKYNDIPNPCETFQYGEVEDYTINILPECELPVARCQDIDLFLDASGNATLTPEMIDNAANLSTYDCGLDSWAVSQTNFDCSNIGSNSVTLTITDINGNTAICESIITVIDTENPTITCPVDINVTATSASGAIVTYSDPETNDNCSIDSTILTSGYASGDTFPIGNTIVEYTTIDSSGNSATCSFTVTVTGVAPQVDCPSTITVNNDTGNCSASVNFGATDNVGIPASVISYSQDPNAQFPVGTTTITATATNAVGTSTCSFDIIVVDNEAPNALCSNITIPLDASGNATITANDVNNNSSDNCGIQSMSVSPNTFDCSNIGDNTVTLTVTDSNGNVSTCNAIVTLENSIDYANLQFPASETICQGDNMTAYGQVYEPGLTNTNSGPLAAIEAQFAFNSNNSNPETWSESNWVNASFNVDSGNNDEYSITSGSALAPGTYYYTFRYRLNGCNWQYAGYPNGFWNGSDQNNGVLTVLENHTISLLSANDNQVVCPNTAIDDIAYSLGGGANSASISPALPAGLTFNTSTATISGTPTQPGTYNYTITTVGNDCSSQQISGTITVKELLDYANLQFPGSETICQGESITAYGRIYEANLTPNAGSPGTIVDAEFGYGTSSDPLTWTNWTNANYNVQVGNDDEYTATFGASLATGTYYYTFRYSLDGCEWQYGGYTSNGGGFLGGANVVGELTVNEAALITTNYPDITVDTDSNVCGAIVSFADAITTGAPSPTITYSQSSGSLFAVGTTTVTVTASNSCGTDTKTFDVTVTDNEVPNAICQNITVQLNASGNASITPGDIDNGSNDACGIQSLSLDIDNFNCSNVGVNTVKLTVTDINNNISTCDAIVTVEDNVIPNAIAQDITIQLDSSGNASIVPADVNDGSNDACGIASLSVSPNTFDCSNIGPNTVTITVTDINGNVSTETAVVTVQDNIAAEVLTQDITIQLDASGNASIVPTDVNDGSNDACGIASLSVSPNTFDCSNIGPNTVTLTATDNNGNVSTETATVTVEDSVAPTAICKDITVQLDSNGNASITAADIDNGSNDACGIASLSIDVNSFDCSNVSTSGEGSGSNSCYAIQSFEDSGDTWSSIAFSTPPCTNGADVWNYSASLGGITPNNGSKFWGVQDLNGNCGGTEFESITLPNVDVSSYSSNIFSFDYTVIGFDNGDDIKYELFYDNVSQGEILLIDGSDNFSTNGWETESVNIPDTVDNVSVIISIKQNGGSDYAGIDNIKLCGESSGNSSSGVPVVLTVTDVNGNSSSCTAYVTVEDNIPPTISCVGDNNRNTDQGVCTYTVVGTEFDATFTDNCDSGIITNDLNGTDSIAGEILPEGTTTVVWTVDDGHGQSATCTTIITINDNELPVVVCNDITVQLDASGNATITTNDIDGGSTDNCGIASIVLDNYSFNCNDISTGGTASGVWINEFHYDNASGDVGEFVEIAGSAGTNLTGYSIVLYNGSGGASYDTIALSGVIDNEGSGFGALSFAATGMQNGGPDGLALVDPSNTVIEFLSYEGSFTATNGPANGISSTDIGVVESGTTSVGESLQRTSDGNSSTWTGPSPQSSGNINVGQNLSTGSGVPVVMTVTDIHNNISTCTATVTVVDNISPAISCVGNNSRDTDLDACTYTVVGNEFDATFTDNCDSGIITNDLNGTDSIAGEILSEGITTVVWTVDDGHGQSATCTTVITINDNELPVVVCNDITVQLDASGNATITTNDIDGGSTDNCGIASIVIDDYSFDCNDVSTGSSTTTSNDLFISEYIEGGSFNKCIEIYNGTGSTIDLGTSGYALELYANGSGSPSQTVSLSGSLSDGDVYVICHPSAGAVFLAQADATNGSVINFNGDDAVVLSKGGNPIDIFGKTGEDPGSSWSQGGNSTANQTLVRNSSITDGNTANANGFPSLGTEWTEYPQDTITYLGDHSVSGGSGSGVPVLLTVTDIHGNLASCTAYVTVEDNINPTIDTNASDETVECDGAGNTVALNAWLASNGGAAASDACGVVWTHDFNTLSDNCGETGSATVMFTATDPSGNTASTTATFTIVNTTNPSLTVPSDITINCEDDTSSTSNGMASGSDTCSNVTITESDVSTQHTDPLNIGHYNYTITRTWRATDDCGNYTEENQVITVQDITAPSITDVADVTINCEDDTSSSYNGVATGTDNCSDVTITESDVSTQHADPLNTGHYNYTITRTWRATDITGNFTESVQIITVQDVTDPSINDVADVTINCEDDTSSSYNGIATGADNCSDVTITESDVSTQHADPLNAGHYNYTITRTWRATDVTGNYTESVQIITVQDVTAPVVDCNSFTIELLEDGTVSITSDDIDNGSSDNCSPVTLSISQENFDCSDIGGDMDELIISEYVDGTGNNKWIEIFNGTGNDIILGEVVGNSLVNYYSLNIYHDGSSTPTTIGLVGLIGDREVYKISHTDAANSSGVQTNFGSPAVFFDGNDAIALAHNGVNVDVIGVIGQNPGASGWSSSPNSTNNSTLIRKPNVNQGNINNFISGLASEWVQYAQNTVSYLGDHEIEITDQANNIILTVTDVSGNVSTCEGNVTVIDVTAPIVECQNVTVILDEFGNGSTTAVAVDNGSTDTCGVATLELSQTEFTCANIGSNTVILTVTDVNGNSNTCTAEVNVIDDTNPIVITQNITVQLDINGSANISPSEIDNGSNDACGIANISVSPNTFDCSNVGNNTVTLTVEDNNGNIATETAIVTIEDNINPNVVCNAITVNLDSTGNYTLDQTDFNNIGNGSSDACGIASMVASPINFTCNEIGNNTVTLTVTDVNGNSSTCQATVTVNGIIPTVNITESPLPEFCQGAVVVLTANSDDAIAYEWTTGETTQSIEVPGNGNYGVTVTSATNCTASTSYTVTGFDAGALISSYTILASQEVHLQNDNIVQTGGVGVTGSNNKIKVHNASHIIGFAQASQIQANGGSTVGSSIYSPANPTVPSFVYNIQSNSESPDIVVNNNSTQTLSGTTYGKIDIKNGAEVIFTESNVYIDELKTANNTTISFAGCTNVLVNKAINFGDNTSFNQDNYMVTLYVNSNVTINKSSDIIARIHANDNNIDVKGSNGSLTYMTGMFIGKKVTGNKNVIWNSDTYCDPCPVPNDGSDCNDPAEIPLPFVFDGAGEFCWETSGVINFINSWNLQLLEINGVNYTNQYTTIMPDRIDGKYYIHYISNVDWGHFEINGFEDTGDTGLSCVDPIEIQVPYYFDGTDEYCWETFDDIDIVNSWSLELLEINGVDFTNQYSTNLPPKIDGKYYIHYISNYSWGHVELLNNSGARLSIFEIQAYPNPFETNVKLKVFSDNNEDSIQIYVYDVNSRLVYQTSGNINQLFSFGERFESGMYIVKVHQGNKIKQTKIIKR